MADKLNITIRIAHLAPIALQIRRHDEPVVRTAEYNVNKLFNEWSTRFTDRTPQEVLAMVAFQFAKAFVTLNNSAESSENALESLETELDRLLDTGSPADVSRYGDLFSKAGEAKSER